MQVKESAHSRGPKPHPKVPAELKPGHVFVTLGEGECAI